jgi:hypothetical protein
MAIARKSLPARVLVNIKRQGHAGAAASSGSTSRVVCCGWAWAAANLGDPTEASAKASANP